SAASTAPGAPPCPAVIAIDSASPIFLSRLSHRSMDRPMPRTLGARVIFGRQASFWIVATTFGLFLFAAAAPSPLYAVYAGLWQFSAGALTEVFAVYAIALLVALLFTGSSSDFVGRRPIILVALVIQLASIVLFLVASGIEWLFAARIAQGIATGIATGALGAALVDLQPPDNPALASLVNSAGPILSLDIGAVAIVITRAWATTRAMIVGGIILGAGLVVAVAAIALTSPLLFFAAPALTGVGFGPAWLGVLRTLVALAAPTARAALLAAV